MSSALEAEGVAVIVAASVESRRTKGPGKCLLYFLPRCSLPIRPLSIKFCFKPGHFCCPALDEAVLP